MSHPTRADHPGSEADEDRVRALLDGMEFPAERQEVVDHARAQADQDPQTVEALRGLPDRVFSTVDDVVISVPEPADGP